MRNSVKASAPGSRLLTNVNIQEEIKRLMEERGNRTYVRA